MAVPIKGVLLSGFLLILFAILTTACGSIEPDHLSDGEPLGGQMSQCDVDSRGFQLTCINNAGSPAA